MQVIRRRHSLLKVTDSKIANPSQPRSWKAEAVIFENVDDVRWTCVRKTKEAAIEACINREPLVG